MTENNAKIFWNLLESNGNLDYIYLQKYCLNRETECLCWTHTTYSTTSGNGRDALQTGRNKTVLRQTQVIDISLPSASYVSCLQPLPTNWPPRMTKRCSSMSSRVPDAYPILTALPMICARGMVRWYKSCRQVQWRQDAYNNTGYKHPVLLKIGEAGRIFLVIHHIICWSGRPLWPMWLRKVL